MPSPTTDTTEMFAVHDAYLHRPESPLAPRQLEFDTSGFVQMELLGLEGSEE